MLPMEEENAVPGEGEEGSAALHARLVALVRAAGGEPEGRVGVWMEHSYARAKSGAAVREMLARPAPADQPLDVGGPGDCDPAPDTQEPEDIDPEWEARVLALAPSAMHARAARAALEALRAFRLARLASAGHADASIKRDQARTASRAVRRALAPLWAASNGGSGVAPWLHGAILAHGSHWAAALWRELAGEWRRSVPRLAARLLPAPAAPPRDPLARVGPPVDADKPGPWLVWICARGEDRWTRRLRALLHVRVICGDATGTGPSAGPGPSTGPEAWCSALMGAARAALLDVLAEAGSHPVVVGGAGAGAAVCGALLSGAGSAGDGALAAVRALALLAPPLLTAEGEATHLNRTEMELPLLVVAGSAGATCPRSLACELAAGGGTARRVLVVRGADDALRLPARLRRRLVPQHALDAAVAEEVARWALTAAEGDALRRPSRKSAGAGEVVEERHTTMQNARGLIREIEAAAESARPVPRGPRRSLAAVPPAPLPPPPPPPTPTPVNAEPAVDELDIMQLPIVFADDEPAPAPTPPLQRHAAPTPAARTPSVTVTSGHPRGGRALNYTRVIVAKRRGGARGPAAPRPVLLRRTVRLLRDN
ncbi:uncharacterized protein LOC134796913 isoform X2 [Cydia splendana]|uniref:uncharacterized protein LOC134796913 isoform X2 n=1 Tax=Cydia splendana TaxID=1100963 RepID=UPI00300DAACA